MAQFFIDRPVFAWVIAIITMLAGALSLQVLPIQQYPTVAPPTVTVSAQYPGASAATVENAVTQIIEQRLTGIDYLRYFNSESSDGAATITLTFEPEADPDIAQVQTQNKVQAALSQLPQEVQALGVTVTKSNNNFLIVVGLYSEDGSYSQSDLGDFAVANFRDPLARINGVGDIRLFGNQYAMRIWVNPDKLYSYNLTPADVQLALQAQNTDVSAGQLGALPAQPNQQINATITAQSLLTSEEDFRNIVLRVNTDGSQVRLGDVARVEKGSESYSAIVRYRRQPAVGMGISLAAGANALETAGAIKARVQELSSLLPEGVKIIYPRDATPFIQLSIESVVHTLIEAVVLVFFVMLLFLQNLRATLIPTIAVPVVLLGTFAVLLGLGFSINVLTMFAMVLAIGLLVDDAIVVVENVERLMEEEGLSPKEATKKSMGQISGALVGIAVVLSTVFIPMAFFSGSAGAIYRQFSVTIVTAMILSVLVAMILSPSLCATFLKAKKHVSEEDQTGFVGWFNRGFNRIRDKYQSSALYLANKRARSVVVYLILIVGLGGIFSQLPGSFIPNEDQGLMYMTINTPPGASAERTLETAKKVEDYFLNEHGDIVEHMFTVVGFSFSGNAQNAALGFIGLVDWDQREGDDQTIFAVNAGAQKALASIKDASVFTFTPPPIRELGNASGFSLQLIDRAGLGHEALMAAQGEVLRKASASPKLVGVRPNGLQDVPQYKINLDNEKASALGLSIADINRNLQIAWGSSYVNDFIDQGRIKRVYVQADSAYRMSPEDLQKWYVRNANGEMVSFSAFSSSQWTYGSPKLERFNGNASVNILGAPAPGISSGEAMDEITRIIAELPEGFGLEWYGISYEERQTGDQATYLYVLSILIVFLALAALYESWAVPFAVMLVVPLGVLGAVAAAYIFGLPNDVFLQVALLTTVGLAAKNAILIVEFAKELQEQGVDLLEAVAISAKQRFRPIIMTSIAFTMGVVPLAISSGAGSVSQNAIGIAVIGGMVGATCIAILFVPLFYVLVNLVAGKIKRTAA
ncbi:efflux RND transporter permease subunit [Sessilibacter sp. MAH1]